MAVTMGIYSHVTDSMKERAAKRSNAELKAALGGKFEGFGWQTGGKWPICGRFRLAKRLISQRWMGGRAVEGTGLENRQGATPRGFESHPIRQLIKEAA
jgi:hypothetical protein